MASAQSKVTDDAVEYWLTMKQHERNRKAKEELLADGRKMITMLDAPQGATLESQSKYTQINALREYGWRFELDPELHNEESIALSLEHLDLALHGLKIVHRSQDWHKIRLFHDVDTAYPSLYAEYKLLVNFKARAMVVLLAEGPTYRNQSRQTKLPDGKIVPLKQWSDVVFLGLLKAASDLKLEEPLDKVKNIEHVIWYNIDFPNHAERLALIYKSVLGPREYAPVVGFIIDTSCRLELLILLAVPGLCLRRHQKAGPSGYRSNWHSDGQSHRLPFCNP